jgi:1-deoxy-D-xylulose-5-phosphate synthase
MDRAGMVGADGQTHMGLYDIAYMLAVPNMTVTAPKDGAELVGLLRCAMAHAGPFSTRYPRDVVPGEVPVTADVPAVPYGTWEILRHGHDAALLAVGVMCGPALEAAELLVADGIDVTVVNCRFIKPLDRGLLESLVADQRFLLTAEDGTAVNGFGAQVAAVVEELAPEVRVVVAGAADRTYEHASRSDQLAEVGLTAAGLAERVRAWMAKESVTAG